MKVQSSRSPSSSLRSTLGLYETLNRLILDHDPSNVNTSCYYDSQYPCPPQTLQQDHLVAHNTSTTSNPFGSAGQGYTFLSPQDNYHYYQDCTLPIRSNAHNSGVQDEYYYCNYHTEHSYGHHMTSTTTTSNHKPSDGTYWYHYAGNTTSPSSSKQFCSSSASSAFSDTSTSGDTVSTATSALENEEVTCSATSSSSSYYDDQGQQAAGVKSLIYCPPPPSYSDQRLYDDEGTGDKMNKNNENKRMRTPPNLGIIENCTKPFDRCAAATRKSLGQQISPSSGGRSAKRRKVTLGTVTP
jgi:hypothetical protein